MHLRGHSPSVKTFSPSQYNKEANENKFYNEKQRENKEGVKLN